MKIKLLLMLTCGGLMASIWDVLDAKPDFFAYFDNYRSLYGISCTNRDIFVLFKKLRQTLNDELPKIQQELFEQFKKYVCAHLPDKDLDLYLSEYFKSKYSHRIYENYSQNKRDRDYEQTKTYFNGIDRNYMHAFLAINAHQNPKTSDKPIVPVMILSKLLPYLRLFVFYLEVKRYTYNCLDISSQQGLNKTDYLDQKAAALGCVVKSNSYSDNVDRMSLHQCDPLKNQFSVCQLKSPIWPYFGLVCNPDNQNEICGLIKFIEHLCDDNASEPYMALGPVFFKSHNTVNADNQNNLIKLSIWNLIYTAPGFIEYWQTLKKIATDLQELCDVFDEFDQEWDEDLVVESIGALVFNTGSITYCTDNRCRDKMIYMTQKLKQLPLIFGPVYVIDPTTGEPKDLESCAEGKISEDSLGLIKLIS